MGPQSSTRLIVLQSLPTHAGRRPQRSTQYCDKESA
jgi:hypothetical protein